MGGLKKLNSTVGVTFVSTFWTAAGVKQKASFNKQLDLLQQKWQEGNDEQPNLYQHG